MREESSSRDARLTRFRARLFALTAVAISVLLAFDALHWASVRLSLSFELAPLVVGLGCVVVAAAVGGALAPRGDSVVVSVILVGVVLLTLMGVVGAAFEAGSRGPNSLPAVLSVAGLFAVVVTVVYFAVNAVRHRRSTPA